MASSEVLRLIEDEKHERTGRLDLSHQKLTAIPKELQELSWLTSLDLSSNQITKIENLEQLKQLTYLYINNNQIIEIEGIENLPNLKSLDLNKNKIVTIEPLLPLIQLGQMEIEIENNNWGGKLNLWENPIVSPPLKIIRQGTKSIFNWFDAEKKELK